ncbi:MAG: polysaccharide deacetylase family protein [Chthonomonadaceae bacterium]|nr:polysaccharide deacetylase family protein [Chthonomonadaceae bacterium]
MALLSQTQAEDRLLVDFAHQLPDASGVVNLSGPDIEKYVLPNSFGEPPILMSTMVKRLDTAQEASLVYTLSQPILFNDYHSPQHEVRLWVHIDGPPTVAPGNEPFSGPEVQPAFINFDFLTENQQYTSESTFTVSRGWNELKFALALAPTSEHVSPDANVHRRKKIFHYNGDIQNPEPITKIRIRMQPNLGTETIGKIRFAECRLRPVDVCNVMIVFDDCWQGVDSIVKPYFVANNLSASLAVIGKYFEGKLNRGSARNVDAVHARGYLVDDDIVALYNTRSQNNSFVFDVVNHSYQHIQLTKFFDYSDVRLELAAVTDLLQRRGLTRDNCHKFVVYPGGASNLNVFAAMDELGMSYGRTVGIDTDPGSSDTNFIRHPYYGFAYDTAAAENGINGFDPQQSIEQFKDWLDQGVVEGKPRFVYFHDISDSMKPLHNANNWNSISWFNAAMDYIRQLRDDGKIEVKTMAKWYNSLDGRQKMRGIGY